VVEDLVCTCGPRDRAFEEQHQQASVAVVVAGSFQYRSGKACELMTPGTVLLGNAGQWFECGHEHGNGDRCVSFHYSPEYFERIAAVAGVRKLEFGGLRIPAVREVSGLVARVCRGIAGLSEMNWEELAVQLGARALELANDAKQPNEDAAASTLARVTRSVRAIERAEGALSLAVMARVAGVKSISFSADLRAAYGSYAAPVCEADAIERSGGAADQGKGEGAGYCVRLRVWGCVEFQPGISRGIWDESAKLPQDDESRIATALAITRRDRL